MKQIVMYTDGSCSGNPGPGGWAAILLFGKHRREVSGAEPQTTNNRMELRAAIEGLAALKEPCNVLLHTDSAYLYNAFTKGWLSKWLENGWKTSGKKPVENQDLWVLLVDLSQKHNITWKKVKGHSNNELNNQVDELCVKVRRDKYGV